MRCAFGQMRARLANRARVLPNVAQLVNCRTFDQLVKCAARLPKCADWSNAPYISIENLFSISFSISFTDINHFSISLSFSYWNITA